MLQEIYSGKNLYAALWDADANGYWIYAVQPIETNPRNVDTDYQVGFFSAKDNLFYLHTTLENYVLNPYELGDLLIMCQHQIKSKAL